VSTVPGSARTTLTLIRTSPDPREAQPGPRGSMIAARVRAMGRNRTSALLLLLATVAAVVWVNLSATTYTSFWGSRLLVGVEDLRLEFARHALVNAALMALFFFTVGLEVRRELTIGELTSWARARVPVIAAAAGLAVPALIFAGLTAGTGYSGAWGVVIS